MTTHWAASYIGIPWSKDGTGPDSYHCWSFVRAIERVHFGRELPEIPNPGDLLGIARLFRDHPEHARWERVGNPVEGDVVQMRAARYPIHVGLWVGDARGGVLHCAQGSGVVYQRLAALAANGWRVEGYYRFKGGDRCAPL